MFSTPLLCPPGCLLPQPFVHGSESGSTGLGWIREKWVPLQEQRIVALQE